MVKCIAVPPGEVAQVIADSIDPASWRSARRGGDATLNVLPTSLVVTQTQANHAEIVKLLYDLFIEGLPD